jgi:endonuclease YncB( thermonuclease family)
MKARIYIFVLIFLIGGALIPQAQASEISRPISVLLNGTLLSFETPPMEENGSVLVPMRGILEGMGASIQWEPETQTVTAKLGDIELTYTIGKKIAYKNNTELLLETPGQIVDGSTLLPVRIIAEALGAKVGWNEDSHTVSIDYSVRRGVHIERVLDGMYLKIRYTDGLEEGIDDTVRFAGISPIHNGQEATAYIESLLPDGAEASIEIRGGRDRNKHLHVNVYLQDNTFLNAKLVEDGYAAKSLDLQKDGLDSELTPLQTDAVQKNKGLWAKHDTTSPTSINKMNIISTNAAIVTGEGDLWTWGQFYEKPTLILQDVVDAKLDSDAGIALKKDGTVWVWGFNNGALWGNGEAKYETTIVPRQVEGLRDIVSVEMNHSSIYAVDGEGRVFAWGSNSDGKLGQAYSLSEHIYKKPYQTPWTDVRSVSPGFDFTVVLKKDGTVWQTQPTISELKQLSTLHDIIAVSNHNNFAVALKQDGTVWTWGVKSYFGMGNVDDPEPKQLEGLANIIQVDAGKDHAMAVDRNGALYAWGDNEYGQLGNLKLGGSVAKPVKVPDLPSVKSVEAGYRQSLILMQDGTLWGVGGNAHYILSPDTLRDRFENNVLYLNKLTQIHLNLSFSR